MVLGATVQRNGQRVRGNRGCSELRVPAFIVYLLAFYIVSAKARPPRELVSLDGEWQMAATAVDERPTSFPYRIAVPGLCEMATPPLPVRPGTQGAAGAYWYRHTFRTPADLPPVALLKINKACYGTSVVLNGKSVGEHLGCFTPGMFAVRDFLKPTGSENELLIRVGGNADQLPRSIPTGHDFEKIVYQPGIYDSVSLTYAGMPFVETAQVAPDVEQKSASVFVTIRTDAGKTADLKATIEEVRSGKAAGRAHSSVAAPAGSGAHSVTAQFVAEIENCHLWTPDDPFLYRLVLETQGDRYECRFGMRSFAFDPATGSAVLNGHPFYLRGTNVCIFRFFEDPQRGDLPWRTEWVRKLHKSFRDMNWNSIRYCIGFPPEIWYDIADEEGFLIQDEFPIWHASKFPVELTSDSLAQQYREWIGDHANHPCVAWFDAQNETITTVTGEAIRAVRNLDESHRPWDNGWSPPQAPGDSFECHPYLFIRPEARLADLEILETDYVGSPIPNTNHNAMVINEYGWLWLDREGNPCTLTRKQYENLLGTTSTAEQRRSLYAHYFAEKTEYWRAQRRFSGVLHFCGLSYSRKGGQTSDNFVDVRNLKFEPNFYRDVRQAFAPVGICINDYAEEMVPGETRAVPIVVTNDLGRAVQANVELKLKSGDQVVRRWDAKPLTIAPVGQATTTYSVTMPQSAGNFRLTATLTGMGIQTASSARDFTMLNPSNQGLAHGKPASASSVLHLKGREYKAAYATDGRKSSRWSSEFSEPHWLSVDLDQLTTVSRVEIEWEHAHAKEYSIEVSSDNRQWKEVYHTSSGKDGTEKISFAPEVARWIRLRCQSRASKFGFSVWEFRVYP